MRLTGEQHARLLADLGADALAQCIRTVDELAQQNGNKYKWRDWNLVLRKCHREGWGGSKGAKAVAVSAPSLQDDKALAQLQRLMTHGQEEIP